MARKATPPPVTPPPAAQPPAEDKVVSTHHPIVALARALTGIAASLTLYAAPCLSGGAAAAVFHKLLGLDLATAFTMGFFALIGPIYLAYASGTGMRRTLAQIQDWERAGLIDAARAEQLRDRAVAWFIARRF
jgi:hypothetical protein